MPRESRPSFEDLHILIYEKKLSALQELLPLWKRPRRAEKPLIVIAEDVEGEALRRLPSINCGAA